jgi:hypothetical protein
MRRMAVLAVLLAAAAVPAIAFAKYKPSPSVRDAIINAAIRAHDISRAQAPCTRVFVSSVNHSWGSVSFPAHPSQRCQKYASNGIALFHKREGRWHFVTAGSYFRCPIPHVPNRVAHDLVGVC